ncbi:mRNA decay activator protein ZFP36L1 [Erpetoichthys calabaricus]|uniref:mRNA decay activator protein ZFP36 n=1 Tax=Erpetoichthys calabaricus TaxID=27687 RepID=A0A8C4RC58_ERPCA|nr:mRNA decay activator protein ZFP36L1 [Erpetoichthys calabaricus]
MPSDYMTPFMALDDNFCKNFLNLKLTEAEQQVTPKPVGFQRRHSTSPVTLANSKFNSGSADHLNEPSCWSMQGNVHRWTQEPRQQLPRSCLNHIPFRVDRSVSMIENQVGSFSNTGQVAPTTLAPPPGLSVSTSSLGSSSPKSASPITASMSSRYKTELCRTFEESGACKYGAKCQFAHGLEELRGLSRHPKYKTEPCRTFHTIGFCPYGARCHFIHNAEEQRPRPALPSQPRERPLLMRQSVSFAGFTSSSLSGFQNLQEPLTFSRASSVSPPPSTSSPEMLSPVFPEPGTLKHGFGLCGDLSDERAHLGSGCRCCPPPPTYRSAFALGGLLQRSTSADSLSDQEGYTSSSSLSGSESPSFEGRRLPIFSRLSVSDD